MSNSNICLGCMNPMGEQQECPKCGYIVGTPRVLPCLAPGTVLVNRYLVGRHLRISCEGVTYIGFDRKTGRRVDIREYLPQTLCTRTEESDALIIRERAQTVYEDYLADFIDVSKAVSRLRDVPEIVPLINIFECNNTAYAVYEHLEGKTLTELMHRANRLSWEQEAAALFAPLFPALSAAHSVGLVHFSLSPETIVMTRSGRLVITDFGIPDARIAETELKGQMYDGFAALEQYSLEGRKGKWTDVYSICAVLLYALTGKRPPDALTRARDSRLNISSDLAEAIPAHVISALACGLQVNPDNRTPSIDELRTELYPGRRTASRTAAEPAPAAVYRDASSRPQQSERSQTGAPEESHSGQLAGTMSAFGAKVAGTMKDWGGTVKEFGGKLGGRLSGYISEKKNQRAAEEYDSSQSETNDGTPWYMNLSQWQYGLLSTSLTIVVLGIIAVCVFLSVRAEISGSKDNDRTLEILYISETDIVVDTSRKVVIPDLVGETWSATLEGQYINDFQILVLKKDYSDDYAKGVIMSQNVSPNSEVVQGTPVGIVVSLGSKNCKVPDIIGKTVSEAHTALEKAGLLMGDQQEEYSDSYPAGTIIRLVGTSVGASMTRDSLIKVVVSLGPEQ